MERQRQATTLGKDYDHRTIEREVRDRWQREGVYRTRAQEGVPKYYCLDMFPYPSGKGLHVGHWRNYTISDVISRYRRLAGYNVMHPMGWDAFGLPAENYAMKTGIPPAESTRTNIAQFRRQLTDIGAMYDWKREVNTSDPRFFRWTQWIFLKFLETGLAYRAEQPINWCPKCQTGLANEEVVDGLCERCGTPIRRKRLTQWMLRITAYADRLLDDLDRLDWPEHVKQLQRAWIGRSEGARIRFAVEGADFALDVFTSRPDTLFGATFVAVAPEHDRVSSLVSPGQQARVGRYLNEVQGRSNIERLQAHEARGVWTGSYARHPLTGAKLPVWLADYVLHDYGTGVVMGVPAHDERDYGFAMRHALEVRTVVVPQGQPEDQSMPATEPGTLTASGVYSGMSSEAGAAAIVQELQSRGAGGPEVGYRLRDWVFSRQRYWGEPIPVVHCSACGVVPVPEDELPLELPPVERFEPSGTGESPLASVSEWVNTTCPCCGGPARRETDTMPQWAGSSWYFLRYADPGNEDALARAGSLHYWLPVDLYVGGVEHATLHLLYARFFAKFLFDIGVVDFDEPFTRLFNQGMVLRDGRRMSKSRGNVVSPDPLVRDYGADALRMYEAFIAAPSADVEWQTEGIVGTRRFLARVYRLVRTVVEHREKDHDAGNTSQVDELVHRTLRAVTDRLEDIRLNTAVSALMEFVNALEAMESTVPLTVETAERLVVMVAPFAPHLADHLWYALGHENSIWLEGRWPIYDPALTSDDTMTIVVQLDGRRVSTIEVRRRTTREEVEDLALCELRAAGREVVHPGRIIYVPGKVFNVVTSG